MTIKLRPATLDDVSILKYWDTKEHVIKAGGADDSYDWEKEVVRNASWQEILIAEEKGKSIGVVVIIDPALEETHYWGDIEPDIRALDIWIGEETDLNKGYGTEMMSLILERCFKNPKVKAVIVDPLVSNTKAHKFYEKMGFKRIEQRKFGDDDCFVYRIEKGDYENKN